MKVKVAVCASGEGSGFEAIVAASRDGRLQADVVGLIASRDGIGALARAKRLGVPCKVIAPKEFSGREEWDRAFHGQLKTWGAEWVVLAGFLSLIGPEVLKGYSQRIVNSHPALLPKYGGAGMYGDRVHTAVLAAKERETGVTVHLIDEVYDRGRILAQERLPIQAGETVASLAARSKALEHILVPKVLNDLLTGRLSTG